MVEPGRRPVRVLLVDEAPMQRAGVRTVLLAEPDLTVVGEAGRGTAAVELARRLLPDVVITDVRLPGLDGVAATRAIVASGLPVRVLFLASPDSDDDVVAALRAGAGGFLTRDVPGPELVAAVRALAGGGAVVAPAILARLLGRFAAVPAGPAADPVPPALASLTERERQVLVQVARGRSNAEIARLLSVGEPTVKTHVRHVLTKLGLRDRVQAVVLAYECGLVRPGG